MKIEVNNMLIKSTSKIIESVIDNEFTKFTFDSYLCRFHVYQTVWSLTISEELLQCGHQKENEEDEFAIGVYSYDLLRETMVGDILRNVSKFI